MLEWTLVAALVLAALGYSWWRTRPKALPAEWPLLPRPLFGGVEEQVYHWLRQSFPEYLVLAKVPLTRFMRLKKGEDPAVWFPLINPLHVTFVVCSHKGYVLAAIDLPAEGGSQSNSASLLKQRALKVCGVRYLTMTGRSLPNAHTIRSLLLGSGSQAEEFRASAFSELDVARAMLDDTLKAKRGTRDRWSPESMMGADSFLHSEGSSRFMESPR
jgi:hypothetical protein